MVIVPTGGTPELQSFNSFDELKEGLADLLGSEMHLYVIQGHHHPISAGPFHYLLASDGQVLPLFDIPAPEEAVPAEAGYVGTLSDDLAFEEEVIPPREEPEDEEDEEESSSDSEEDNPYGDEPDDDDDEVTGIQVHRPG